MSKTLGTGKAPREKATKSGAGSKLQRQQQDQSEPTANTTSLAVGEWLGTTGYAVEAATAKLIHDHGYFEIEAPSHYCDLDGKTVKELDVTAYRVGDARSAADYPQFQRLRGHYFSQDTLEEALSRKISVSLRIECKYAKEPWVVFSTAADHATGKPMTDNVMCAGHVGDLLPLWDSAGADTLPLLFNTGVLGRALRQAKVNTDGKAAPNTDDCYKAIMSALVASHHAISESRRTRKATELCIPVIVVSGKPLFNAVMSSDYRLSHTEIDRARILYRLPNKMDVEYAVDVVHVDHLLKYIEDAASTADGVFSCLGKAVYDELFNRALSIDRMDSTPRRPRSPWV